MNWQAGDGLYKFKMGHGRARRGLAWRGVARRGEVLCLGGEGLNMGGLVRMTRHAKVRIKERAGKEPEEVERRVARKLRGLLRCGIRPDDGLRVKIRVADGLVAVCVPSQFGGWSIVTVFRREGKQYGRTSAR